MTRTVLVTGGNRGIGLEVVKGFAHQGYKVLMACRDKSDGQSKCEEIQSEDVHVIEMDLSSTQSIDDGVAQAEAIFGTIDVLVNNAGVLCDKRGIEATPDELIHSFRVHVSGPYHLIQKVIPGMKKNRFGRIINVSSGWGAFSEKLEGPLPYAISKSALNALTLNLSSELSLDEFDITINSVCPGWVHTRMGGQDAPKTPEQGADTIVWLGTLESQCPNGQFFRDRKSINW